MDNVREHDSRTIRTRRRLGVSITALALVGAGAVSAAQAFADTGNTGGQSAAAQDVQAKKDTGKKSNDKRGYEQVAYPEAGQALEAAVAAALADGVVSDVNGRRILAEEHIPETVAADLGLAPTAGAPAGSVSVYFLTPPVFGAGISSEEYVSWCPEEAMECEVSTLADGSLVRTTTSKLVDTPTGPWIHYRVDRLVDGVVIGVNATAPRANDEAGNVLAPNPPLTMEQLVEVAAQLNPMQ